MMHKQWVYQRLRQHPDLTLSVRGSKVGDSWAVSLPHTAMVAYHSLCASGHAQAALAGTLHGWRHKWKNNSGDEEAHGDRASSARVRPRAMGREVTDGGAGHGGEDSSHSVRFGV